MNERVNDEEARSDGERNQRERTEDQRTEDQRRAGVRERSVALIARTGRFVVLQHTMPAGSNRATHWDFLLEQPAALATWALAQPPDAPGRVPAQLLPPHRAVYLAYEGPISGDRGHVRRWDAGEFQLLEQGPTEVRGQLAGERLTGTFLLRQNENAWLWEWSPQPGMVVESNE